MCLGEGAYIEKYGVPRQTLKNKTIDELVHIFAEQVERVRNFVSNNPSHMLIEVAIEDVHAGSVMENAFGIEAKCWGHANENKNLKHAERDIP